MILVDIKTQKLIFKENNIKKIYPISSSKFGIGGIENSNKTPYGLFTIKEKIGDNMPAGVIFKAREIIGSLGTHINSKLTGDLVCTRIMWLDGQDSHNKNTFRRYIYFHGTNQEELIGTPKSHGCIRMRNLDIVELFDLVKIGEKVFISN